MSDINNETRFVVIILSIIIFAPLIILSVSSILTNAYLKKHSSEIVENNEPDSTEYINSANSLINRTNKYSKYLNNSELIQTYRCSNTVLSNARTNPAKYVLKYSKLNYDMKSLQKIDYCVEYSKDLADFYSKTDTLYKTAKKKLPIIVQMRLSKEKFFKKIYNIDLNLFPASYPVFKFLYVSPAGKTQRDFKIYINTDILEEIQSEISSKISKKENAKMQRNKMTNDLRNAIKKRDNYTCCICGNSVYKEPNLLLEVDHIVPIAKGGKTEADNLQTLCWRCNRNKH